MIEGMISGFEMTAETIVNSALLLDMSPQQVSIRELEIRSAANKAGQRCIAEVDKTYTAHQSELSELLRRQAEAPEHVLRQQFLDSHSDQISLELTKAGKPARKIPELEACINTVRLKKVAADISRDTVRKEKYKNVAPVKGMLNSWPYWAFVFLLLPVEFILNAAALDSLRDGDLPPMFIWPTAATLSFMIAVAGHYLGNLLAGNSKWYLVAVPVLVLAILLGIVFYIRANSAQTAFVLVFINVAAALLVTFLSYNRHRDDPYFVPADQAEKLALEEASIAAKINDAPAASERAGQDVLKRWNVRAARHAKEAGGALENMIAERRKVIEIYKGFRLQQVIEPIEMAYHDACLRFQGNVLQTHLSKEPSAQLIEFQPLLPLDFYKEAAAGTPHEGHSVSNGQARQNANPLPPLAVLIICLYGLPGCDTSTPSVHEGMYIGDWTIEAADSASLPSVEEQASYLLSRLGVHSHSDPQSVTRDSFRLGMTHIDRTSLPAMDFAILPSGEPTYKMVKPRRRKLQEQFVEKVSNGIALHSKPQGLPFSNIGACLCETLVSLAGSKAKTREILIVSDMILNDPETGESFYRRGSTVADDYEKIAMQLDRQCPAMQGIDLGGIHVTAVYLPGAKDDAVARYARQFWARWFSERGGRIEFLPNLPSVARPKVESG